MDSTPSIPSQIKDPVARATYEQSKAVRQAEDKLRQGIHDRDSLLLSEFFAKNKDKVGYEKAEMFTFHDRRSDSDNVRDRYIVFSYDPASHTVRYGHTVFCPEKKEHTPRYLRPGHWRTAKERWASAELSKTLLMEGEVPRTAAGYKQIRAAIRRAIRPFC